MADQRNVGSDEVKDKPPSVPHPLATILSLPDGSVPPPMAVPLSPLAVTDKQLEEIAVKCVPPGSEQRLVQCPDCNHSVSRQAAACPACGRPLQDKVQTIERTSKDIKLGILLSLFVVCCGPLSCVAYPQEGCGVSFMLVLCGLIGFVVFSVAGWWKNG